MYLDMSSSDVKNPNFWISGYPNPKFNNRIIRIIQIFTYLIIIKECFKNMLTVDAVGSS